MILIMPSTAFAENCPFNLVFTDGRTPIKTQAGEPFFSLQICPGSFAPTIELDGRAVCPGCGFPFGEEHTPGHRQPTELVSRFADRN
jgi:hypothetical protein